ncbi:MAG: HNH endonuclease [Paraburkholderia tropica]|nr:HNH endonuclease [Paraburkholderia tropica]
MSEVGLTAERLRELLWYNPETGVFTWRVRPGRKMRIGQEAGSMTANGYVQIKVDKRRYLAHRLAWLHVHGEWPIDDIDHINGVRTDNRIENLRDVTGHVNMQNLKKATAQNKTAKMLGVTMSRDRYQAQIKVDGKYKYLGVFESAEAAHEAYLVAKRELHPGCTI